MKLRRHLFCKINFKFLASALMLLIANTVLVKPAVSVGSDAKDYLICSDFMFVFARGSGAEVGSERDFVPFKDAVDSVFGGSGYSYSFYELGSRPGGWNGMSYPAPGIGISTWERFNTSLGALFSGGKYNDYGNSVEDGSDEAMVFTFLMRGSCPNTKIVLAGYSQGAQVVSRTLQKIEPSWIFAALTFGDPKLYLPEGELNLLTASTAACRGEKLSDYRAFVPDCYAHEGILGGYKPYQSSSEYSGKLKAYCQYHDIICSSYIDLDNIAYGHATYDEQGTYRRAIEDVYNMVRPRTYNRPAEDLAILFDITGSMAPLLAQFKTEAIRAAKKIIDKGGKVALYTYGDLSEVEPVQLCNFETCNSDNIESLIKGLSVYGGGDLPESLLSASYTLMRELKWDIGANKSLIVLTDAEYLNPDRDGITLDEVVELSKSIDPVNFYILTEPGLSDYYQALAEKTEGGVYTSDIDTAFSDLETELLSREPAAIYVSTDLPAPVEASISYMMLEQTSDSSVRLNYESDGVINLVSINDYVAGYTEETNLGITDLDLSEPVQICILPVSSTGLRGERACVSTELSTGRGEEEVVTIQVTEEQTVVPKAPNTGKYI